MYRTIELSEGFDGFLTRTEVYFFVLDFVPLLIALVAYVPFWPGRFIPDGLPARRPCRRTPPSRRFRTLAVRSPFRAVPVPLCAASHSWLRSWCLCRAVTTSAHLPDPWFRSLIDGSERQNPSPLPGTVEDRSLPNSLVSCVIGSIGHLSCRHSIFNIASQDLKTRLQHECRSPPPLIYSSHIPSRFISTFCISFTHIHIHTYTDLEFTV